MWLIYIGALVRIIAVFCFPQLSDDIYRFVWDGRLIHEGINPYAHLPIDIVELHPDVDQGQILGRMNSPEYYTVYPPVSQFIFFLSTGFQMPIAVASIIMKSIFLLAELVTLLVGLKILRHFRKSPRLILIYWLSPLVILEGIGNLHFEVMMITFLSVAMWYWARDERYRAVAFLAVSVGVKLISLLLLPYWIWKAKETGRVKLILTFGVVSLLIFSPLIAGLNFTEFGSSIDLYFRKFEFNASVYYILREIGTLLSGYNLIAYIGPALGLLYILSYAKLLHKRITYSSAHHLYIALFLYLLLSTTVHPWYVCTLVFCSVFIQSRAAIVWSGLIVLSYINYSYADYYEPLWMVAVQYIVLITFIMYEYRIMKLKTS